jgi:hypothetical protein
VCWKNQYASLKNSITPAINQQVKTIQLLLLSISKLKKFRGGGGGVGWTVVLLVFHRMVGTLAKLGKTCRQVLLRGPQKQKNETKRMDLEISNLFAAVKLVLRLSGVDLLVSKSLANALSFPISRRSIRAVWRSAVGICPCQRPPSPICRIRQLIHMCWNQIK